MRIEPEITDNMQTAQLGGQHITEVNLTKF